MTVSITSYNEGMSGSGSTSSKKVYEAIRMMRQAKGMEDHAKDLKKRAKAILEPFHVATGARQLLAPELGRVDVYFGSNKSTNPKLMADELIKRKVKATIVQKAMEAATVEKTNKSATVKFTLREKL